MADNENVIDSGIIPASRRIEWKAGVPGGIPDAPPISRNVKDYGAVGDGSRDDTQAFKNAISGAEHMAILIPAGTYKLTDTLSIGRHGVVLLGEGARQTELVFTLKNAQARAIRFGGVGGNWVDIQSGYRKGSKVLTLSNASGFTSGTYIEYQEANDTSQTDPTGEFDQSWAQNLKGQMNKVVGVSGNTMTLDKEIYQDYLSSQRPKVRSLSLLSGCGLEDLKIRLTPDGDPHTVEFDLVRDSWIFRCELAWTSKYALNFVRTYQCEVLGNYFHQSHDYGDGGHGYGINLQYHATDNLMMDNIFVEFRHSMISHLGSTGNVWAYNYSREGTRQDLAAHGHWLSAELFEGNHFSSSHCTDYWGPAGPFNTYLRNKIRGDQSQFAGMGFFKYSRVQNYVGNDLLKGNAQVASGAGDILRHYNWENGGIQQDSRCSNQKPVSSYLFSSKPWFFGSKPWPPFGADEHGSDHTLPAEDRWSTNAFFDGVTKESGVVVIPSESLTPSQCFASAIDGQNKPINTLDNNLGSRWSAEGYGQCIFYDLDAPTPIIAVDIAWHQGDRRRAAFDIQTSDSIEGDWVTQYSGMSSGSTLEL